MFLLTFETIFGATVGFDIVPDDGLQDAEYNWCIVIHLFLLRISFFHYRPNPE